MIYFRTILSVVFERNRRKGRVRVRVRVKVRRLDNWTVVSHLGQTEGGFLEKRCHLEYGWKVKR